MCGLIWVVVMIELIDGPGFKIVDIYLTNVTSGVMVVGGK